MGKGNIPTHIAIIMDGNGRWAKRHGLARIEGHRRGMKVAKSIIEAASDIGVKFLTLYTFSIENWKREKSEVEFLMKLCQSVITEDLTRLMKNNVRLKHIGRLQDLPESLQNCIRNAENLTKNNNKLSLQLAFNYGSRQEVIDAVRGIVRDAKNGSLAPEDITEDVFSGHLYTRGIPDPDLLIRTSGEFRISNFLLWQLSYAEFYITKKLWPDFNKRELMRAIREYRKRRRRFGGADD